MADFEEKKYSIDPGPGKKMDGCPYSNYEDGHDVQEYIIPPKGYVFSGFRFDPDAKNQIYDGKLYAQYSKEPFQIRLKSNMWKLMLAVIIVVIIGLIVLLASSVFKEPNSQNNISKDAKTEATSSKKLDKTDNSLGEASKKRKKDRKERRKERKESKEKERMKKERIEKERIEKERTDKNETVVPNKDSNVNNENVQSQPETVTKTQEQTVQQKEPVDPIVTDPNALFKQEFWEFVHQRNPSMDAYTDLYNKYKADVKGEEFDYLRFTILKDYVTFKDWFDKMRKIPEKQLSSINSIDELVNRIN